MTFRFGGAKKEEKKGESSGAMRALLETRDLEFERERRESCRAVDNRSTEIIIVATLPLLLQHHPVEENSKNGPSITILVVETTSHYVCSK